MFKVNILQTAEEIQKKPLIYTSLIQFTHKVV